MSIQKTYKKTYHDGVNDIVLVVLQGLDGLGTADVSLGHDQLNIVGIDTSLINLLTILLISSGGLGSLNSSGRLTSILEDILSSLQLRLQAVGILSLTLTEDNVGIRDLGLEDIRLSDGQDGLTGTTNGHTGDSLDLLETQLGKGLTGLDLTTGLNTGRGLGLNIRLNVRVDLLDGSGLVLDISPKWKREEK